jgi:hypothetical protein
MEGCLNESSERRIKEEFEDTKGGIRIRILKKDRQHNGQRNTLKKAKRSLRHPSMVNAQNHV